MHAPRVHILPGSQTLLHAPQFASVSSDTHPEPHSRVPAGHWHSPFAQGTPWQAIPHAPQLRASLSRSTHAPPHTIWSIAHAQLPLTHARPASHTTPQLPQLLRSLCSETQTPRQRSCPKGQGAPASLASPRSPVASRGASLGPWSVVVSAGPASPLGQPPSTAPQIGAPKPSQPEAAPTHRATRTMVARATRIRATPRRQRSPHPAAER